MQSKANTIGTDMSRYKIVAPQQFAFNPNTARMGDKIPIALNDLGESCIVSQIYPVFEIVDHSKLLPEYLMMWFKRPEFDRYARFHSHGSAREIFDWQDMCEVELPVPDIQTQQAIVDEYQTVQRKIALNEQLISKLEETAQTIYQQWFVNFDFPDENGNPYQSSGGEMEFSEELEKDIPKGWEVKELGEIADIKAWWDKPDVFSLSKNSICNIPIYANWLTDKWLYWFTNKANYPANSITISARWSIWYSVLRKTPFDAIVRLLVVLPHLKENWIYLRELFKNTDFDFSWSVQSQLTIPQISGLILLQPTESVLQKYEQIWKKVYDNIYIKEDENNILMKTTELLLSKIASGER